MWSLHDALCVLDQPFGFVEMLLAWFQILRLPREPNKDEGVGQVLDGGSCSIFHYHTPTGLRLGNKSGRLNGAANFSSPGFPPHLLR